MCRFTESRTLLIYSAPTLLQALKWPTTACLSPDAICRWLGGLLLGILLLGGLLLGELLLGGLLLSELLLHEPLLGELPLDKRLLSGLPLELMWKAVANNLGSRVGSQFMPT